MSFAIVPVRCAWVRDGLDYQERMLEWIERAGKGKNYTGIEAPDRHLAGYVGEAAFYQYLIDAGCEASWKPVIHDARRQTADVYMAEPYRMAVDVKCHRSRWASDIYCPLRQYRRKSDITHYASVYYAGEYVEIKGLVAKSELLGPLELEKGKEPVMYFPISKLRPVPGVHAPAL